MQQYLPLAVLKLKLILHKLNFFTNVATVLTACGIETLEALTGWFGDDLFSCNSTYRLRYWNKLDAVASSMDWKRCNSTYRLRYWNMSFKFDLNPIISRCNSTYRLRYWNWTRYSTIINTASDKLQQYLPLAVLKQSIDIRAEAQAMVKLQQYLPLAVLKREISATSKREAGCNSTYRLRYWNARSNFSWVSKSILLQQYLPFTVLKHV